MTARAEQLLGEHQDTLYRRTDRLFAGLMVLQWLAGMAAAHWITPRTWVGASSQTHPHVWDALVLGGLVTLLPVMLALWLPGRELTRHVIAIGQLVMSGLLIHFTGGRTETHFHVFGSLAFLAFYRDWRVLVTASVVTAADHYLRGVFWPQSLYGTASVEPWRWLEHAGWVIFEDTFLIISCVQSTHEMRVIAERRAGQEAAEADLEQARERLEERVQERTAALTRMSRQNQALLDSAGEGIYGLDEAGRTTFLNPVAAQMLGYTPDELRGRPMHDLLHHTRPDGTFYPCTECPIYASLADGEVHHVEDEVFWRKDGTSFSVDYVCTPLRENNQIVGAVVVFRDITERKGTEAQIERLHTQLKQRLEHITTLNAELSQAYDATIEGWSRALDLRDHETEGHSLRVTEMTLRLAETFGITEDALLHIQRGALLHDIGKMGVPDAILNKPGPLTDDERAIMCLHPTYAHEMLSGIPFVHLALDIPYCHHEKWDGTGYPRGLKGEDIPFAARLFAIVDVWDALRSDRPYRQAWTEEQTRAHIASLAGTHFEPYIVDVFLTKIAPAYDRPETDPAEFRRAA